MKTKKEIQRELKTIERLLCRHQKGMNIQASIIRGKSRISLRDRDILYGAAQTLGWVLEGDYMKASSVVRIENEND